MHARVLIEGPCCTFSSSVKGRAPDNPLLRCFRIQDACRMHWHPGCKSVQGTFVKNSFQFQKIKPCLCARNKERVSRMSSLKTRKNEWMKSSGVNVKWLFPLTNRSCIPSFSIVLLASNVLCLMFWSFIECIDLYFILLQCFGVYMVRIVLHQALLGINKP